MMSHQIKLLEMNTPYSSKHSKWYPSTYTLDAFSFKRALAGDPIYMNHLDCVLWLTSHTRSNLETATLAHDITSLFIQKLE
jgi:hypothetical protein